MAEVIGTASAITGFVTLALQSSMVLYQTIQSLHSRDKMIRELRSELDSLQGVLIALEESIANIAVDLTLLQEPLIRCKNACEEFNALIIRCTPHSTEERSSRRDWLKLRYMGEDISGFKNMLSGYKSTISIALAYANLHTTKTTRDVIEEYKDLIENTKYDLESHLHAIRTRLQSASAEGPIISGYKTVELQMMEEEKNSTQKSLDVCEQFLTLIDESRPSLSGDMRHSSRLLDRTPSSVVPSLSWLINAEGLNSAQKEITSWKLRLLQHLHGIGRNMQGQQNHLPQLESGQAREDQGFKEELNGTEALLEFCKRAEEEANRPRTHYFEDVSTGDNSRQAIITTLDDLISAKRIKSGNNSYQALGRMADESIQSFFRRPEPGVTSDDQEEQDDQDKGKGK
ncbi:hypothetical protein N7492_006003 [Penicillium capsulatum]|uniref:Azaphilone pigments biosynthesis cluster protein L N-terminal domain-containing protein n=1 Tax=Penicillium capsulatum TaxID=69766 RepID=A0A9W9LSG9_9EURO|nr:hypothetical protein N7492_006003 [Penicillium capsulatum]KAJ6134894.1 hypothetical protein N7512_000054 [Penicillium capsulatum]